MIVLQVILDDENEFDLCTLEKLVAPSSKVMHLPSRAANMKNIVQPSFPNADISYETKFENVKI